MKKKFHHQEKIKKMNSHYVPILMNHPFKPNNKKSNPLNHQLIKSLEENQKRKGNIKYYCMIVN